MQIVLDVEDKILALVMLAAGKVAPVASAYLEKSGYGSRAAAPVVKCMFMALAGAVKTPAVAPSNPLDVTTSFAAPDRKLPDNRCLGGGTTGGRD